MAAHTYLKNEFTEDKKCQNLVSLLIWPEDADLMANSVDLDQLVLDLHCLSRAVCLKT